MITKKTLTRQSIDELAKICPPVTADYSHNVYGGTHYYSQSGYYLGKVGPSDDIMIADPSLFNSYSGEIHDGAIPSGCMLSSASQAAQYAVVSELARGMMGSSVNIKGTSGEDWNMAVETNRTKKTRTLKMSYGKIYMDNMNTLMSTLEHENIHYNDSNIMNGTGNLYDWEYYATMSQTTGVYWASTDRAYKEQTYQSLLNTFVNLHYGVEMPEFEKQRIRQEMGL